jgi:hypothetical protein
LPAGGSARRIQRLDATGIHLLTLLKTIGAIALISLVLPLFLLGATGHVRNSLRAWWSWWKYMVAAFVLVSGLALVAHVVERIG